MPLNPTRLVAAIFLSAGFAIAQEAPKESGNPLAGPPVRQARPPVFEEGMGPGADGKERMAREGIPPREFARIIDGLRGEDAPPSLRLSGEQDRKIRAIEEEFRQKVREAEQKTRRESAASDKGGQRGGDKPAEAGGGDPKARAAERPAAVREQMRRNMPRPAEAQAKVWGVLNEAQQAHVQKEIDRVRSVLDARRDEEYAMRELQRRRAASGEKPGETASAPVERPMEGRMEEGMDKRAGDGPAGPATGEGAPPPMIRERFRKIAERLQQLPPDERDELLRKLERELDARLGASDERAGSPPRPARRRVDDGRERGADAEKKPAPEMKDVEVPPAR